MCGAEHWGTGQPKTEGDEEEGKKPQQEPNFGLSGALAKETNTVRGVELLHTEPPEARKPDLRWRLYIFKNGAQHLKSGLSVQHSFLDKSDANLWLQGRLMPCCWGAKTCWHDVHQHRCCIAAAAFMKFAPAARLLSCTVAQLMLRCVTGPARTWVPGCAALPMQVAAGHAPHPNPCPHDCLASLLHAALRLLAEPAAAQGSPDSPA